MKKNIKKILAVLLALICAISVLSGCTAKETGTTPDESGEQTETEAEAEKPARDPDSIYQHVVIVGVDGAGRFFRDTDTPRIDEIFADGAVTYDMLSSNPPISAQAWGSLLCGVIPEVHGFNNVNILDTPNPVDSDVPTVFRVIRGQMPDAKLGSICNWGAINNGIVEDGLDVNKVSIYDDAGIAQSAADYIRENKPTFTFVHLGGPDDAGHGYGYGKKEHLASITQSDVYIGQIFDACVEAGIADDMLFIVTPDHGGEDKSHGGWLDQEKYIMYAVRGKTVVKGGTIEDSTIRDTAAIVLYALGLEDSMPDNWTGRVPSDLFEGVTATERKQDIFSYALPHKTHETEPTPEIGSGASVVDALGEDRVQAYFTFDRTIEEALGNFTTEETGKIYYPDAFFGSGAEFDDGHITVEGFDPGTNDFSIGFWMKVMSNSQDPAIIGNAGRSSKANPGFVIGFKYDWIQFTAGNKKTGLDTRGTLPEDYRNAWTYCLVTVDRANARIGFSFDFSDFTYDNITEDFLDVSFSNKKPINIGQDGTGRYTYATPGIYDEMIFVNGVMTNDDIATLRNVYLHEGN